MSVPLWKRSLNRFDSSLRRFASGESDEAFLAHLYVDMLCRPADVGALAAGTRKLDLGFVRRGHVRRDVASSTEYRALTPLWKRSLNRFDSSLRRFASGESDEAFMAGLYEKMLGRRPDPEALSTGTRSLRLGLRRRGRVREAVASSPEYRVAREREDWLSRSPAPAAGRSLAGSPPEEVWLELTTRCNIVPACAMCGYASGAPEPRRDMDPATWRSLVPLLRRARIVGLHGAGEPLLYPFLGDLLEALRPSPAVAGFNSNGHLLTAAVGRRLVEQGLGWISISLDASNARTYLRIRRRPDFDALLSKVRMLCEIRDAAGAHRPQVEINMTLMRLNLPEAPGFVELAARLGADRVMFQEMQPGGSRRVVAPDGFVFDYREQELAGESLRDEVLNRARERARALGLEFNSEILYGSLLSRMPSGVPDTAEGFARTLPVCAEPWKRLLFDVRGDAFVCCTQRSNGIHLGNVPRDPLEEIWNGRRARLVREAMFGGHAARCCAGCYRISDGRGESCLRP